MAAQLFIQPTAQQRRRCQPHSWPPHTLAYYSLDRSPNADSVCGTLLPENKTTEKFQRKLRRAAKRKKHRALREMPSATSSVQMVFLVQLLQAHWRGRATRQKMNQLEDAAGLAAELTAHTGAQANFLSSATAGVELSQEEMSVALGRTSCGDPGAAQSRESRRDNRQSLRGERQSLRTMNPVCRCSTFI